MSKEKSKRKLEHEALRGMQAALAKMKAVKVNNEDLKEIWSTLTEHAERATKNQEILFENEKVISEANTIIH